jgi:hypothetical protein
MGSKQSMTAGEFSVGLLSGLAGSIITITVQNIRDWLIQPRLKVDNVMGGRLETILLQYGGTLRSLAFKEKSPGGWGSARQGSRLPSPRVSAIVQWRQRSGARLLPFCGACRVRPHLRAVRRPLNLYMYTTNAITAATPYVSARAATTAPTLPHGTALQNTISSQTSDGVTVISSRGRLLVEERGTAA